MHEEPIDLNKDGDRRAAPTVVIGLGNPLMTDDGVGLAALDQLRSQWQFVPPVELIDGGTWGLNLLPILESAGRVLLLDAIDVGSAPGEVISMSRTELPRLLQLKVSPHQIAVSEVLALAELRGTLPDDTIALGLQPERVELATALSPACARALGTLVDAAVIQLEDWGHWALPVVGCAKENCGPRAPACSCASGSGQCCNASAHSCSWATAEPHFMGVGARECTS
jgi:hydrogenase maturation protease